jgi:hypothetical protein
MATLSELADRGDLFRLDPELPANELENRFVYLSPKLRDWMANTLPDLVSDWDAELTPQEEVAQLFETFCSGVVLTYDKDFKPLYYTKDGAWELRTIDIRIFGWFPEKNYFVGVVANTAKNVHDHGLTQGHAGEACYFREALDLNEPKSIPGRDPNAVVSNWT